MWKRWKYMWLKKANEWKKNGNSTTCWETTKEGGSEYVCWIRGTDNTSLARVMYSSDGAGACIYCSFYLFLCLEVSISFSVSLSTLAECSVFIVYYYYSMFTWRDTDSTETPPEKSTIWLCLVCAKIFGTCLERGYGCYDVWHCVALPNISRFGNANKHY